MRGHRRACEMMMPLSIEKESLGKPSMFHARMATGSPSVLLSEKGEVQAIWSEVHRSIQRVAMRSRKTAHVAGQVHKLTVERGRRGTPPVALAAQPADEPLRAVNDLGLDRCERRLFLIEQGRDRGKLGLRLGQRLLLRFHHLSDPVVHLHRTDPAAKTKGRLRRFFDHVRVEGRIVGIRADLLDHLGPNIILVELHEIGQKLGVGHHLLGGPPVVVHLAAAVRRRNLFRLDLIHDAHCFEGELHPAGWTLHTLHLGDVVFLECAQSFDRVLERRQRLGEPRLALGLDRSRLGGLDCRCSLLDLDPLAHLLRIGGVLFDTDHQLIRLLSRHHEPGLQLDQFGLHGRDRFGGEPQLLEADVVPGLGLRHLGPLRLQKRAEGAEQLEVGGGRHVVVPAELRVEVLRGLAHRHLEVAARLDDGCPRGVVHLHLAKKGLGHSLQRVVRPRREPVDCAAVDQRREFAQPVAEGVADR
eukprot:scaffold10193_cov107-Isochrysis_galbana.AAC.7